MGITEIVVVFFVSIFINICFYKLYSLYIESEIYDLRKEIEDTENDTKFLSEKIQKISEDFWKRRKKSSTDLKKLKKANRKLKKKFNKLYKLILDKDQVIMEPVVDSSSELHIDEIEELIDIDDMVGFECVKKSLIEDSIQNTELLTLTDEKLIPLNPEETIHEPIKIQESASEKLEEGVTVKGRKVIDGGNIISRWKNN